MFPVFRIILIEYQGYRHKSAGPLGELSMRGNRCVASSQV